MRETKQHRQSQVEAPDYEKQVAERDEKTSSLRPGESPTGIDSKL